MNPFSILHVLGNLLLLLSLLLLTPLIWTFVYSEPGWLGFVTASLISAGIGLTLRLAFKRHQDFHNKDIFIITTFAWVFTSAISAIPFVIEGVIPSFTDAFFEMMSGYSTTGATILTDIERLPHTFLFWRGMTHFIGGMGILMLAIFILPLFGIEGIQLYKAEAAPGQDIGNSKIHPRIRQSVKWLWMLYLGLNAVQIALLTFGGMPFFDAICHAFGTISTGGYSNKNLSMGFYNSSYFEWVTILFMFLGGTNFFLLYSFISNDRTAFFKNTEFRWYSLLTISFGAIVTWILLSSQHTDSVTEALRMAFFQVVSIITTTGFITSDYELWPNSAQAIIFLSLFSGACAGSTTSGIKIVQMVILWKYLYVKVQYRLRPLAVVPIQIDGKQCDPNAIGGAISFFVMNIFFIFFGSAVMVFISELDFRSAFFAVIATVWNIGPGFGMIGPTQNFAHISDAGTWFLSFCMLAGRLDIATVLVLFYPSFWKR